MTNSKVTVLAPVSIRNRYIRDETNSDRVLTIVTRLIQTGGTKKKPKHKIEYGISVNSPPRMVILDRHQLETLGISSFSAENDLVVLRRLPGDKFSRIRGRTIATGQLNCERTVRSFEIDLSKENPYEKVLKDIITLKDSNPQAARIAKAALTKFQVRAAELNLVLSFNETPSVKKVRKVAVKKDSSNVVHALHLLEDVLQSSPSDKSSEPFPTILVHTPETQVSEPA